MQQPPETHPDPVQGIVAELSKRLDSIETTQRESTQALRQDNAVLRQDMARIESHQRESTQALRQDNAVLRQDMARIESHQREDIATLRQDNAEINRRIDRLTRWIIGIQLTTLIALGTLILTRLPG